MQILHIQSLSIQVKHPWLSLGIGGVRISELQQSADIGLICGDKVINEIVWLKDEVCFCTQLAMYAKSCYIQRATYASQIQCKQAHLFAIPLHIAYCAKKAGSWRLQFHKTRRWWCLVLFRQTNASILTTHKGASKDIVNKTNTSYA